MCNPCSVPSPLRAAQATADKQRTATSTVFPVAAIGFVRKMVTGTHKSVSSVRPSNSPSRLVISCKELLLRYLKGFDSKRGGDNGSACIQPRVSRILDSRRPVNHEYTAKDSHRPLSGAISSVRLLVKCKRWRIYGQY